MPTDLLFLFAGRVLVRLLLRLGAALPGLPGCRVSCDDLSAEHLAALFLWQVPLCCSTVETLEGENLKVLTNVLFWTLKTR